LGKGADGMTTTSKPVWQEKVNDQSRMVVDLLREHGFANSDAYRFSPVSIRVRVIDERFEGLSHEARDAMIEPVLDLLPRHIQSDIVNLLTFAPSDSQPESEQYFRYLFLNSEFDNPRQSGF
jgi:stress-induced morphogen